MSSEKQEVPLSFLFVFVFLVLLTLHFLRHIFSACQNCREGTESSHLSPILTHAKPPPLSTSPTLTHHNHPKGIFYIKVHSHCCTSCGFGQIYNDKYLSSCKILPLPPAFPSTLATTDLTISLEIFFPFHCKYVRLVRQFYT